LNKKQTPGVCFLLAWQKLHRSSHRSDLWLIGAFLFVRDKGFSTTVAGAFPFASSHGKAFRIPSQIKQFICSPDKKLLLEFYCRGAGILDYRRGCFSVRKLTWKSLSNPVANKAVYLLT
jgi:hypothetical protein